MTLTAPRSKHGKEEYATSAARVLSPDTKVMAIATRLVMAFPGPTATGTIRASKVMVLRFRLLQVWPHPQHNHRRCRAPPSQSQFGPGYAL